MLENLPSGWFKGSLAPSFTESLKKCGNPCEPPVLRKTKEGRELLEMGVRAH